MPPEHPASAADGRPCAAEAEAVAWLQGELDGPRSRAYAAHLASCEPCQRFVGDARQILGALAASPPVARAPRRQRTHVALLTAVAAALLLLAVRLVRDDQGEVAPPPVSWHLAHLASDGTWHEGVPTGLGSRRVGLHALALMALTREAGVRPDATHRAAVSRAATWLLDGQGADGGFGLDVAAGSMDHVLATRALLEAWVVTGDGGLSTPLVEALELLASAPAGRPDAAGAWADTTLRRAAELGLVSARRPGSASDQQALASLGPAERLGPLVARSLAVLEDRISE